VITDEDVEGLVEALNTGRESWISGRIGSLADGSIKQDEDMTLYAPSAARSSAVIDRRALVTACPGDRKRRLPTSADERPFVEAE
jgi:hypothetical protein